MENIIGKIIRFKDKKYVIVHITYTTSLLDDIPGTTYYLYPYNIENEFKIDMKDALVLLVKKNTQIPFTIVHNITPYTRIKERKFSKYDKSTYYFERFTKNIK